MGEFVQVDLPVSYLQEVIHSTREDRKRVVSSFAQFLNRAVNSPPVRAQPNLSRFGVVRQSSSGDTDESRRALVLQEFMPAMLDLLDTTDMDLLRDIPKFDLQNAHYVNCFGKMASLSHEPNFPSEHSAH